MVWLYLSPIPVGRRGVISSFKLFLPAFDARRGGSHCYDIFVYSFIVTVEKKNLNNLAIKIIPDSCLFCILLPVHFKHNLKPLGTLAVLILRKSETLGKCKKTEVTKLFLTARVPTARYRRSRARCSIRARHPFGGDSSLSNSEEIN
jgi:hypothetical protein